MAGRRPQSKIFARVRGRRHQGVIGTSDDATVRRRMGAKSVPRGKLPQSMLRKPMGEIRRRRQLLLHCRHTGHPWPASNCSCIAGIPAIHGPPAIAPALPAYRSSMARRQLLPALPAYRPSMARQQLLLHCRHTGHPWP
jgi:hypothetical protein